VRALTPCVSGGPGINAAGDRDVRRTRAGGRLDRGGPV